MKISYNWLKNYIDLDPVEHSPECLQEVLPLLGFDIEEIEKLGRRSSTRSWSVKFLSMVNILTPTA